jgi:hypothetical protein
MSKQGKLVAVPRNHPREGEGYVVESQRRTIPLPNGTQSVQVELEMSRAPVPDRRYQVDVCAIQYRKGIVELMLGQKTISGQSLRSLIVIHLSSMGVLLYLRSCEKMRAGFKTFIETHGLADELEAIAEEPQQTVSLTANVVLAAYSGREACLDFYFASPYMMSRLSKNEEFAVEPVVRVTLSAGLMWAMLLEFEHLKSLFPVDERESVEQLRE